MLYMVFFGDDHGNIWLSTNNGLSKFNPETLEFRNYSITDGLQSNQFSWGAFSKTRNGESFFGGINGLNSFFPENIEDNKNIPPVYIHHFPYRVYLAMRILTSLV
jgi:ligand-binding sensor domain-containing protein